jgi:hypothetical protein
MPQNRKEIRGSRRVKEAFDPYKARALSRDIPDCKQFQKVREAEREFKCEVS